MPQSGAPPSFVTKCVHRYLSFPLPASLLCFVEIYPDFCNLVLFFCPRRHRGRSDPLITIFLGRPVLFPSLGFYFAGRIQPENRKQSLLIRLPGGGPSIFQVFSLAERSWDPLRPFFPVPSLSGRLYDVPRPSCFLLFSRCLAAVCPFSLGVKTPLSRRHRAPIDLSTPGAELLPTLHFFFTVGKREGFGNFDFRMIISLCLFR